jgi:hypothetical protein
MKFLLEYNQFNNDDDGSFHLSKELRDDIKEVLTDYLEDVVEERIPKIKVGKISTNFQVNRLYAHETQDINDIDTAIFIDLQDYLIPLEHHN